jgi:hypothetical protein
LRPYTSDACLQLGSPLGDAIAVRAGTWRR